MPPPDLSRAAFLRLAAGAVAARTAGAVAAEPMLKRTIPSTGRTLPVVGCGTWRTFDVAPGPGREPLAQVLRTLFAAGGSVIDSSPMYGRSEEAVGDLLTGIDGHARAFVATKVWTTGREAGIDQMRRSLTLLQRERIELMQVHNLLDWRTHLATLRDWKAEGRIGHLGVTHYTESAHDALEAVMRAEALDFVQINYALDDRAVERRILPLAAERGIAVLVNQPFGGGGLLRGLRDRPLPGVAAELGCTSWAQLLLKFVLGHPAVTCVIPGTSRPAHMADNAAAGRGPLPDAAMRRRILAAWEAG
ncbi:aldo/keto reductase [Stella sp.]|uniref:aldo/keto reductase n=1 Tax=Stella sp. TaxID=2912054 RepID=UPI0035B358C4